MRMNIRRYSRELGSIVQRERIVLHVVANAALVTLRRSARPGRDELPPASTTPRQSWDCKEDEKEEEEEEEEEERGCETRDMTEMT